MFISALAVVMIASSHSADRKVHEIASINEEVKELRSIFVEGRSKLMRMKMESNVRKRLKEKGLVPSTIPPKKIRVATQEQN